MDALTSIEPINAFIDSPAPQATLGLVYGRRRIGKSTLLSRIVQERRGFYWEATRAETAIHLNRLGQALGAHRSVGQLYFETWEDALTETLRLGRDQKIPIVLDEFGYVIEADSAAESILSSLLGSARRQDEPGTARLILCGSAISIMRALTAGEAPLRGRAGLELLMQPFDFRNAASQTGLMSQLVLACHVYAVIGGVIGYATDMVDHDLPRSQQDFVRWLCARVLSPAATLHHEAVTLLAEEPSLTGTSTSLYHSILGAIANGAVTAGTIANKLRRSVPNIDPALKRLIAAGFVVRHEDPIRAQRPLYALGDPFLQFHYAILEPHRTLLRDRDPLLVWNDRLASTFDSRVRGPVFEEQARQWVRKFAASSTLGGAPDFVGPSLLKVNGEELELDIVVAAGDAEIPSERSVLAIGEAKAGALIEQKYLYRLERARAALGERAAQARLLLIGTNFDNDIRAASKRHDVEIIDLERLYHGE